MIFPFDEKVFMNVVVLWIIHISIFILLIIVEMQGMSLLS